ncbi:hypothetical protein FS837_008136 [Tulasnella sp. UAMH 9824]|nr:hypothetical protein FS837_008136 [Tulasnella sp. UAMH 9824]
MLLWNSVVAVASGTRAVYTAERVACPILKEFLDLAPVAALLEADTDGIPEQELESVRQDALQFAIQGRRRYLVKLRNIRDGLPLDELNDEDWSTLSDNETIARLDKIAAELVHAVNGFWDPTRKTVDWYPSARLSGPNVDLGVLTPAEALAPGMISKVLGAIGKDPNAEAGAVTSGDWGRKPVLYRCARCDERVAPHLTFTQMVSHFLENKVWFDKASDAREKMVIESSGSKGPHSYSTIFNDHDWNAEGDLVASDNSRDKARVTKMQNQLEAAYGNDPEDYDGEDFTTRSRRSTNKIPERRIRRICRLCPEGFSPQPMYFAALKVHIEHIHCKVANVEEDTAVFNPRRDSAPANPWVFDVQFLSL